MKTPQFVLDFKKRFSQIQPFLILAPTTRCGSTLLQRAINQANDAIIYGENFNFLEGAPQVMAGNLAEVDAKHQSAQAVRDEFLGGHKGIDGSGLFPDYPAYRQLMLSFFYQLAEFYHLDAGKLGYDKWGLKHQIAYLPGFHNFLQIIPGFRSVTIFRDLVAVAKSMHTRWPENLKTEAQCYQIGRQWRHNLHYLLRLDRSLNLVIRYEDLESKHEEVVPRIEQHFGIKLSRDAFAKRVNAHTFDPATGKAGEVYRAPTALPPEKLVALLRGAQPLYGRLGYSTGKPVEA